jgi:hypothetical protein
VLDLENAQGDLIMGDLWQHRLQRLFGLSIFEWHIFYSLPKIRKLTQLITPVVLPELG